MGQRHLERMNARVLFALNAVIGIQIEACDCRLPAVFSPKERGQLTPHVRGKTGINKLNSAEG